MYQIYYKYYKLILVVLLTVAVVLRLYRICEIPRGLHVDEVGMAYDAWSISQFGVDRYLKSFPVYLTNFGGGQSALYCYLTALLFKIGGVHPTGDQTSRRLDVACCRNCRVLSCM